MKIRTKTGIILMSIFLLLLLSLIVFSRHKLISSFEELERQNVKKSVERVLAQIEARKSHLNSIVGDWAPWDDTYRFVLGLKNDYVTDNLMISTFVNLDVNFMVFMNVNGDLVYARGVDLVNSALCDVPPDLLDSVALEGYLWDDADGASSRTGVTMLKEGPLLMASQPILQNDGRGPSNGTLIVGRWLDSREIGNLSELTKLSISIRKLADAALPDDFRKALHFLEGGEKRKVFPLGPDRIAGYSLIRDIGGNPLLMMRVQENRQVYRYGKRIVWSAIIWFLAFCLIAAALITYLLEVNVLSRVRKLDRSVCAIAGSDDASLRLHLAGSDELNSLVGSINIMLEALEGAQNFRTLIDNVPDPLFLVDSDGCFVDVSWRTCSALGYSREELIGASLDRLDIDFGDGTLAACVERLAEDGSATEDRYFVRKDGSRFPVEVNVRLFTSAGRRFLLCIFRDQTGKRIYEERLHQMAYFDSLTGLPNRLSFMERLNGFFRSPLLDRKTSLALLMLDIDRLKWFNDSLGHSNGDRILVEFSRRLQASIRSSDYVARLGGDQFAVLMDGYGSTDDVVSVASRILASLAPPMSIGGEDLFINCSIGIVLEGDAYSGAADLLRDVDFALYHSKEGGGGQYTLFSEDMRLDVRKELAIESELRTGLQNGEFFLLYQPIFDVAELQLKGFEALVRWRHPERGILSPGEFIGVAEETGLIVPLDRWVMNEACRQMAEWNGSISGFEEIFMNVNVSIREFAEEDFVDTVEKCVIRDDFDPEQLTIEITESFFMQETADLRKKIESIRKLGVHFAIDDFGTGFSSLSYLKDLPVNYLKIDKSFIDGFLRSNLRSKKSCEKLVEAIVSMGHAMEKTVIAEGIEEQEQLLSLRKLQCHFGQGYLFSRPVDSRKAASIARESLSRSRRAAG